MNLSFDLLQKQSKNQYKTLKKLKEIQFKTLWPLEVENRYVAKAFWSAKSAKNQ